jgi:hypothetical protein
MSAELGLVAALKTAWLNVSNAYTLPLINGFQRECLPGKGL